MEAVHSADESPVTSPTIVVCLKWVPIRPEIDPMTGAVSTDQRFSGLSPADRAALEWGLRLADQRRQTVTAVTVGSEGADVGLREALAHGAETAIRIAHQDPSDLSSRDVANGLAIGCAGASLVLCGDYSLDRGSGSVPAFLANELGFGQALGCVRFEADADGVPATPLVAERRLDQGRRERLAIADSTVVSFEGSLELRRAPLAPMIDAPESPITVLEYPAAESSTNVSVVSSGPSRPRPRVLAGPEGSTMDRIRQLTGVGEQRSVSKQLELEPAEAADAVLTHLRSWGYLDS